MNIFRIKSLHFFVICFLAFQCACAQTYVAGQTYYGTDQYIEYQPGNIPLIISVPHGGYLQPANIPDRNCDGCSYLSDAYTQELARQIRDFFVAKTGCYPHVVYNLLHRKKLDMNRNLIFATDSNSNLDIYWQEYHKFIDSAKQAILSTTGKGLFLDLHGHGHTKQRIEYGYLLYDTELQESDSMLNTLPRIQVSSIRNLAGNNLNNFSHAELIRGDFALGTLVADRGFPGVPSKQDTAPLVGDPYFNGGYNTLTHGSNPGGTIDAIQLELYSSIRYNVTERAEFADSLVSVLRQFIQTHYVANFTNQSCAPTSVPTYSASAFSIYPNPSMGEIFIHCKNYLNKKLVVHIYNLLGNCIFSETIDSQEFSIKLSNTVTQQWVWVQVTDEQGITYARQKLYILSR